MSTFATSAALSLLLSVAPAMAAPTPCSLASLAGNWVAMKSNIANQNNSRCTITISATGVIQGSCVDVTYTKTSSPYSYAARISLSGPGKCVATFVGTFAGGSIGVRGEAVVSPDREVMTGYFSNSFGGHGAASFTRVP